MVMKKILRTVIITLVLLTGATVGILYWLTNEKKDNTAALANVSQEESGEQLDNRAYIFSTAENSTPLLTDGAGKNVLVFDHASVYDTASSKNANDRLTRLSSRTKPTFKEPLIAYNPYGTNPNTFYFCFETNRKVSVKYRITVEDETIPDFVRTVYNGQEDNVSQKHEFTVGGLVPGMTNYIILTLCSDKGEELENMTFSYAATLPASNIPARLTVNKGKVSEETCSNGLFQVFPKDINYVLSYDNSGILRGETLLEESAGKRMVANGDNIYYQISKNRLTKVSSVGQVLGVYSTKRWGNMKDFDYDGYGNLYAVTQKKSRSYIARVDVGTQKAVKTLTFDKKVHAQSITVPGDGSAFVSSKSPSSVIKVSNIASTVAKVSAVFGKKSEWKNTKYSKRLYQKEGKYALPDGINLLLYNSDKSTLSFLNNNRTKKGESYYYEYQWKDEKKSFTVFRNFKVPYSEKYGSGQWFGTHYVVCSGDGGIFSEYDTSGKLIKEFTSGMALRSTVKVDFKQTCFN